VRCPTLVLSSARSAFGDDLGADAFTHDIVLDVEHIRRWASSVGRHVTSLAIEGAMHDVVLSRPDARARAYAAIDTWLRAWVERSDEQGDEGGQADDGDHRA
jgi:alpha-beta hydrolase superfamily lysophospholipase